MTLRYGIDTFAPPDLDCMPGVKRLPEFGMQYPEVLEYPAAPTAGNENTMSLALPSWFESATV